MQRTHSGNAYSKFKLMDVFHHYLESAVCVMHANGTVWIKNYFDWMQMYINSMDIMRKFHLEVIKYENITFQCNHDIRTPHVVGTI